MLHAFLFRNPASLLLAAFFLWGADVCAEPKPAPAAEQPAAVPAVEVFGTVVDAETGEAVEAFLTQAGHFDPKAPKNVTWGYSETRTASGRYSATIKWSEGWTARIVADGYVPQPIVSEAPPAGKPRIEKVIRLKKGRKIRGRVLNHQGQPVKGASVFAIRPSSMTLAGGKVVQSFDGEEDKSIRGVKTDAEGRFEMTLGEPPKEEEKRPADEKTDSPLVDRAPGMVVSSPELDAWPVPLPEGNAEAVIQLPAPTRVEIRYDIEGSDDEAKVFLQSVMHDVVTWKGFEIVRHLPVGNQGKVEITSLPPGRYQFARSRMLHHGNIGQGQFLDRQFVEITPEKPTTISFERPEGTRLKGSVEWDEKTLLTGVIITVRSVVPPGAPARDRDFPPVFDARLLKVSAKEVPGQEAAIVGNRGLFLTERIPPGIYEVQFDGYAPLSPEQQFRTGLIRPSVTATTTVAVPKSGATESLKVELKPSDKPAKRIGN